jgi:hypothetical protein
MKKIILSMFLLGTLLSANAQVPNYVPSNGLVGWYPFSGNANDQSGNGNNGTVNNATLTTDRFGNTGMAYGFDGVSSYIYMGNISKLNNTQDSTITISTWLNYNTKSGDMDLVSLRANNNNCFSLVYNRLGSGKLFGTQYNASSVKESNAVITNSLNSGQWYHVVISIDNLTNIGKIYLNGSIAGQVTGISTSLSNLKLNIGSRHDFNDVRNSYFSGNLDDIGIWNRALTTTEISDLYNGCKLSISKEPMSQNVNINQQAQFTLSANDNLATYQWQSDLGTGFQNLSNAGQYSGAQNDTLTVSSVSKLNNNQNFRCIVKSGPCLDTSNLAVLKVFDNVGLENLNIETIKVYPNPSSTQVIIDNGNYSTMGTYTAKIVNSIGQQVFQSVINQQQFVIDAKTMGGAGVYTLYITDANNKVVGVKKIVLQ